MTQSKKIHIIGICGAGMSALAVLLKKSGWAVSGSDEGFYEPVLGYLHRNKIKILSPYNKKNIPDDASLVVIGKHAKLDQKENAEVAEALSGKYNVKSLPEVLSELTKGRENIVVVGSYGKSTCAALLGWYLENAGKDPGCFFGAVPEDNESNALLGKGKHFVLEGDEYPASNTDDTSKFLYLRPTHALLTSCEHDHVNVFPTLESYLEPYKKFVKLLPKAGLLVANINNPNVAEVIKEAGAKTVTYGMGGLSAQAGEAQWHPENIKYGAETSFDLVRGEEKIITLSTTLLGAHNIENIVGVSALLLEKELLTVEELAEGTKTFRGLKRRLDLKTEKSSVLIYEGFGSSYRKAKVLFEALRFHFPNKKIVTVFEPHTFSWRNADNLAWYENIFDDSDVTIIWSPPEYGKDTHNQATLAEILTKVKENTRDAYGAKKKEEVFEILEKTVATGDIILLMSSGNLGGLIAEVPKWAEKKFPK